MKCETCTQYHFYKAMLDMLYGRGSLAKAKDMPCIVCVHFKIRKDNYTPISPASLRNAPYAGHGKPSQVDAEMAGLSQGDEPPGCNSDEDRGEPHYNKNGRV